VENYYCTYQIGRYAKNKSIFRIIFYLLHDLFVIIKFIMAACNISDTDSPSSPSMSQTSSQSKFEWEILHEKISNEATKNFIKNKMPPHRIYV
jgi:hypothetical protein